MNLAANEGHVAQKWQSIQSEMSLHYEYGLISGR